MGDRSSARREPDAAIEAAAGLLGTYGPVDGGLRVRAASAAAHLGISRTTLYRRWPSMQDLGGDLILHAATGREGWYHRILRARPERGIRRAFASAIGPDEVGARFRGLVAPWPHDAPIRRRLAAWEDAWLERFAAWLGGALDAAGVAPRNGVALIDLAVIVAGLIDGQILLEAVRSPATDGPRRDQASHIAQSVELMLWSATAPVERAAGAPRDPSPRPALPDLPVATDPARTADLDALLDADRADRPDADARVLVPTRLVDETRLARHLGVTPRGVRMRWPSAAAFNSELVEHLVGDQLAAAEACAMGSVPAFLEAVPALVAEPELGARDERYLDLVAPVFDQIVRVGCDPSKGHPMAAAAATLDPDVAERTRQVLDRHQESSLVLLRALFQVAEAHLRPALAPEVYTGPMHGAAAGFQRLAMLHPGLMDRRVDLGGRSQPIFGFGYFAVYHGLACDAVNDGSAHEHHVMPGLPVEAAADGPCPE